MPISLVQRKVGTCEKCQYTWDLRKNKTYLRCPKCNHMEGIET